MKQILVSGLQPTGRLHIGNYLGMLKNAVDLQNSGKYQCYYFIADLHSLTGTFEHKNILELAADCLAAGLDPKKSTIFQQSQIPAHSELAWILNTITPIGELSRMTQFKEKANEKSYLQEAFRLYEKAKKEVGNQHSKHSSKYFSVLMDEIKKRFSMSSDYNVGLLIYPVLQTADIFLYDTEVVPVGHDQLQHLELTRTIARKFNARFGKTFIEPQPILTKTPRVMALDDPMKKMSKSSPAGCLFMDDSPEEIKKKIGRAVTDSGSKIKYDREKKPEISNLLEIYSAFSGIEIPKLEKKFAGKGYGAFKSDLATLIADYFADFRKKKKTLMAKPSSLKNILNAGSKKAAKVAAKKMTEVKKKVGIAL